MTSVQLPLLEERDAELDDSLNSLETFFGLLGFCHYTWLRATLSWIAFIVLAVVLPFLAIEFSRCSGCERYEIPDFELEILVFRAVAAAVSLLCVSRTLRKYGVRKALFVDRCHGHLTQFRKQYIQKIHVFYCLLASWFGICFLLKMARELTRILYLLSIVQLVGIVLCLTAAAKISHRAQSLGSVASRWHAMVTCNSNDAFGSGYLGNAENHESSRPVGSLPVNYSESDLESADLMPLSTNVELRSSASSYHKRQAFVTYVQSNTGGFTIFGWMVDRMLINTIFFIELSLVFFVLGKTVTITAR